MRIASLALVTLIALEHVWFMVLEMFLFTTPTGIETFKVTQEFAHQAAPLMKNQGLYNGFLAAGLFWSLVAASPVPAFQLRMFFLGCVAVAGIFGALTVDPSILFAQGLPALIGMALVALARRRNKLGGEVAKASAGLG
jgi:putative membrane protein